MAPELGPLTQGVPCTQPSEIATLMSLNRSVALRTLWTSGEFFHCAECCASCSLTAAGSEPLASTLLLPRTSGAQSAQGINFLSEEFMIFSQCVMTRFALCHEDSIRAVARSRSPWPAS